MTAYIHEGGLKLRQKVRAVVVSESGEFLLVRPHGYRDGEWTLAGGGVEHGETPYQAMRREIAEELGVTLEENLETLPVTNRFIYEPTYKVSRNLDHDGQDAVMFVVRLPSDTSLQLQTDEIADARWFSMEEALGKFPVTKQRDVFAACVAKLVA